MNGAMDKSNTPVQKGPKSYKLLVDPFLVKGATKIYRYDGYVPNDPTYPSIQVRDPRSHLTRLWTRLESLDIPVPRYIFSIVFLAQNTLLDNYNLTVTLGSRSMTIM